MFLYKHERQQNREEYTTLSGNISPSPTNRSNNDSSSNCFHVSKPWQVNTCNGICFECEGYLFQIKVVVLNLPNTWLKRRHLGACCGCSQPYYLLCLSSFWPFCGLKRRRKMASSSSLDVRKLPSHRVVSIPISRNISLNALNLCLVLLNVVYSLSCGATHLTDFISITNGRYGIKNVPLFAHRQTALALNKIERYDAIDSTHDRVSLFLSNIF